MNCRYCGSPLPAGALFCGECGRSVSAPDPVVVRPNPTPTGRIDLPSGGRPHEVAGPAEAVMPEAVSPRTPSTAIPIVGASTAVEPERSVPPDAVESDPARRNAETESAPSANGSRAGARTPGAGLIATPAGVVPVAGSSGRPAWATAPPPRPHEVSDDRASALPSGLAVTDRVAPGPASVPAPSPILPVPSTAAPSAETGDLERTRIVGAGSRAETFVLQFSTGESVTVSGSGLIGRNPSPEPGEWVDHTVPLFDAGRSVSKTHLEFGQEGGRFWVADRYSTNGTVIRQPGEPSRRCVPGRRYLVARGTRIDIGEQFLVVS